MLDRTVIRAEFDRARDELHAMAVTLSKELHSVDEVFRGSGGSADWKQWVESWGLVDAKGRGRRIVLSLPGQSIASRLWWRTHQYSFEDAISDDRDRVGAMLASLVDIQDRVRCWPTVGDIDRGSSVAWDAVRPDVFSDPDTYISVCDALEVNEQLHDALTGAVMEMVA